MGRSADDRSLRVHDLGGDIASVAGADGQCQRRVERGVQGIVTRGGTAPPVRHGAVESACFCALQHKPVRTLMYEMFLFFTFVISESLCVASVI